MRANSQFAIAIHGLTLLALSDVPISSSNIAGSTGSNPAFIRRIMSNLQHHGLITTQMGVNGGMSLACSADELSLIEIYDATQQMQLLELHQSEPLASCLCGGNIKAVLSPIFLGAEQALRDYLAQYTLQDVVDGIISVAEEKEVVLSSD